MCVSEFREKIVASRYPLDPRWRSWAIYRSRNSVVILSSTWQESRTRGRPSLTQEKRRKLQKKSNLKNKDRGEAAVRFAVSVCRLSTSFLLFLFVCLFVAWFERLTVGCLMSSRKMEEKKGGCGREAFLFFFTSAESAFDRSEPLHWTFGRPSNRGARSIRFKVHLFVLLFARSCLRESCLLHTHATQDMGNVFVMHAACFYFYFWGIRYGFFIDGRIRWQPRKIAQKRLPNPSLLRRLR